MNTITIISLIIAIISLLIAVYQTYSMQKLKKFQDERCSTRCKDLSNIVGNISEKTNDACIIVRSINSRSSKDRIKYLTEFMPDLTGKIEATMSLTGQLIRFCERLNEEHKTEYGHFVDKNLSEKLKQKVCSRIRQELFGEKYSQ